MQQEIKMAAQRLVLARLTMLLGRKMTAAVLGTDEHFDTVQDMVLCKAVFIAQLEGRPLTAAKLAAWVGIPRTTVTRRMQALAERGTVVRDSEGRFTMPVERMNSPEHLARVQRAIAVVKDAAAELTEMDNVDVASAE